MRNITFFGILILVCCAASCDPHLGCNHYLKWYLKNCTSQTIYCEPHNYYKKDPPVEYLSPGDSTLLLDFSGADPDKEPDFYDIWSRRDDLTLKIYSADGTLLKEWRGDDWDKPGRQFFNESFWHKYQTLRHRHGNYHDLYNVTWVFDLLPEDIETEGTSETESEL